MEHGYHVAIVGATGAVGLELLSILEERKFPVAQLSLLASKRSAGRRLVFAGEELPVQELTDHAFQGVHFALFSVSAAISKAFDLFSCTSRLQTPLGGISTDSATVPSLPRAI